MSILDKIQPLLDKIKPLYVEIAGFVIAAGTLALKFDLVETLVLAGVLAAYVAVRFSTKIQAALSFLQVFAKVPAWPKYVLLAIAAILGAFHGGLASMAWEVGLAVVGAGQLFDALY